MRRLKAILFDMDDTLINWEGWSGDWRSVELIHLRQVYDFLDRQQRLFTPFGKFVEAYGQRSRDAWSDARTNLQAPHLGMILLETLVDFGFEPDEQIGLVECLEAYRWTHVPGVTVFPDVPPLLQQFQERGVQMGIVTNASQPMWLRDNELEYFGLLRFFPNIPARISAADAGYLKPHRSIFERALQAVNATPEETVFIGDNPVADIAGAQAAGMKAILRVNHPAPPLISGLIVPDAAVNSFKELPPIFDDWFGAEW